MASKTSPDPSDAGRVRRLSELAAELVQRRSEVGRLDVPHNAGNRRTASKRALLKAIEEAGGRW